MFPGRALHSGIVERYSARLGSSLSQGVESSNAYSGAAFDHLGFRVPGSGVDSGCSLAAFRGPDANPVASNGRLPDKWSKTENVEWLAEIPGRGWSSPIVSGDKVLRGCTATALTRHVSYLALRDTACCWASATNPGNRGSLWSGLRSGSVTRASAMVESRPWLMASRRTEIASSFLPR